MSLESEVKKMGTDIHGVFQKKEGNNWIDIPSEYEQDRHYLLFALLGNVRNGDGFAGIPSHTPIDPLSDSRGLPEGFVVDEIGNHLLPSINEMDPRRRKWLEPGELPHVWMGDHSHSWVTGNEILNYTFPIITTYGVVDKAFYDNWDGKTAPQRYCRRAMGKYIKVSNPDDIDDKTTHVRISWQENVEDKVKYFLDEVKRLIDLHGEIRFVFGFDS